MADRFRTDLDWEDLRVFIALARHGSLSGAARALSVNHATVARRVGELERALGRKLAERRPDGYRLTPAGQQVLLAAGEMEAAAAVLRRDGLDGQLSGLVRINATPSLAQEFLVPHLSGLALGHPGLDIEIATDMRSVSLERREADIALRLERPPDGDVLARPLATLGFGFYAAEAWVARLGAGSEPRFVGFDEANAHLPEARWLARQFPGARLVLRADSQSAQAAAAQAGAGLALLPHFVGRSRAGLIPCPTDCRAPPRQLWLVTRRRDAGHPAIRTVGDALLEIFRKERALFEGG